MIPVAFPIHPRTRKNLCTFGLLNETSNIRFLDPLSYLPFISMVSRARLVLTDSGGIQEESTVLGVPCLTMRNNTERPITCSLGTNICVHTDARNVRRGIRRVVGGGGF